jgi:tRNA(Ile)-lysidine synthase
MDRLHAREGRTAFLSGCIRQVEKSIKDRMLFRDGQKILVAVSGGVDSMMLLHVLGQLSKTHGWKLTVAHFNHQLRGAAGDADERLVRQEARSLRLPSAFGRGDVGAAARRAGISLEMAGRKLRHDFLARTARRRRIPAIALGHHADDQVELFFLRLLRGTGGQGLAGMQWSNPSPSDPLILLVRPLLDQSKAALRQAAGAAGVRHREDATNAALDIHRNRVRRELIPLLRRHYQPRLEQRVLRLMDLAGAEADVVAGLAARWLEGSRRAKFNRLALAVQRRVIYMQLSRLGHAPDFDLVERLRAAPNAVVALNAGQTIRRDAEGMLRLQKTAPIKFDSARGGIVLAKRTGRAGFGGLRLSWEIKEAGDFAPEANVEYFDADKVGEKVWLRHWQPGDRFQPIGTRSARKLQDLFTNMKVPRAQRHRRVVAATARGELFWVEGLRMSEGFKLGPKTVRRLKWRWRRE